jgi:MGT family glycosyltransferase
MTTTRVLILTLPEKGHYHPFLGPAAALVEAGADVAWTAPRDIRAPLGAAGFHQVLLPAGTPAPSAENRGAALAALLHDPARLRAWIRALLVDAVEAEVDPLRRLLRDFRPDVVVIDPMAYQGAIAAHLEGLPWVGWSTSLNPVMPPELDSALVRDIAALAEARQALFRRHGMEVAFRVSDVLSPYGTAVFTTEALAGPAPPGVHLVGPSLPLRPRGESAADLDFVDGRPLVYVSFGSQAYHQPAWFARLFEAAAGLPVAVLAAMGELAAELAPGAPSNVRCVEVAPQLEVLAEARALVTHGGANSVMEALSFGVPLLMSPLCNDQPHNLMLVERSGAGARLDLETSSVAQLRAALTAAVEAGPMRAAAAALARSYGERSGARGAAALVLACARPSR